MEKSARHDSHANSMLACIEHIKSHRLFHGGPWLRGFLIASLISYIYELIILPRCTTVTRNIRDELHDLAAASFFITFTLYRYHVTTRFDSSFWCEACPRLIASLWWFSRATRYALVSENSMLRHAWFYFIDAVITLSIFRCRRVIWLLNG
jgi:hypothetical protein